MPLKKTAKAALDNPANEGARVALAQGGKGRQAHDYVAQPARKGNQYRGILWQDLRQGVTSGKVWRKDYANDGAAGNTPAEAFPV
jgi:hypothetical protein